MKYLLFIVLLGGVIFTTGCISENNSIIPNIENKLSTIDPSEMALQPSDLPEGYIKGNPASMHLEQNSQNFWNAKKGYQVSFVKGSTISNNVIIGQAIVVVPTENVNTVLTNFSSQYYKGSKGAQLSNPNIGDSSIAFREDTLNGERFVIVFVKKDVVEIMSMSGTQTDYEILKTLAKNASDKIK